jgi:hypothetical protein
MNKKIIVIAPSDEFCNIKNIEHYAAKLETEGNTVGIIDRNFDHDSIMQTCAKNFNFIKNADEVHVFYHEDSDDVNFNLGMAFMAKQYIVVAAYLGNSNVSKFSSLINEWETF